MKFRIERIDVKNRSTESGKSENETAKLPNHRIARITDHLIPREYPKPPGTILSINT